MMTPHFCRPTECLAWTTTGKRRPANDTDREIYPDCNEVIEYSGGSIIGVGPFDEGKYQVLADRFDGTLESLDEAESILWMMHARYDEWTEADYDLDAYLQKRMAATYCDYDVDDWGVILGVFFSGEEDDCSWQRAEELFVAALAEADKQVADAAADYDNQQIALEIADTFHRIVARGLTAAEADKVNAENANATGLGADALHDVCDPNPWMASAYEWATLGDYSGSDEQTALINRAWGIALESPYTGMRVK